MSKVIILLLLLGGCTMSNESYSSYADKFIGISETALYETWGYPTSQFYIAPGIKEVTYVSYYTAPLGGETQAYSGSINYSAINQGLTGNPDINSYYCKTSFTISNGIVIDYTFNGDDCVVN